MEDAWNASASNSTARSGLLWIAGWLFTIGYQHLGFWRSVLAIVIWPYYIGAALAPLAS
jgi:hypothetical protein